MPPLPDRPIAITELAGWLRRAYPCAASYPSHHQLRNRVYNGIIRTETVGRRVFVPPDQIAVVVKHFNLDQQFVEAAD